MPLIVYDSHCHLESIQKLSNHTTPAIVPGVNLADTTQLLELRASHPVYKIGFGLHPWFIGDSLLDLEELNVTLSKLIVNNFPDFIGEIGLDKYKPDFTKQIEFFETQVLIAKEYNLPVIVHCVKAYNEVLSILKKHNIKRAIIHGFNANEYIAKQFYEMGFLLGIGSLVSTNSQIAKVIVDIPSQFIVVESDAPYMPAFGRSYSSSADCFLYAQIIARYKNISLIDVINQANYNLLSLFS